MDEEKLKIIKEKASSCKNRKEFQKKHKSAYETVRKAGILNEVCSHMPKHLDQSGENNPRFYWTKELIQKEALECATITELRKKCPKAYHAAQRLGIIKEISSHMKKLLTYRTDEEIIELARKCKTRGEMQEKYNIAYQLIHKRKITNEAFAHMPNRIDITGKNNSNFKYSVNIIKKKSINFQNRGKFALKQNGAYNAAIRNDILDTICAHMKRPVGSKEESELLEFLKTINSDFTSKRFDKKYQIDCYSESLKLGIEYNGLFWHSQAGLKRGRPNASDRDLISYHLDKTKYFEELGIRIIHIWEHEWENRQEQVKDYLKSACGANKIRIGARKCDFREIFNKECKDFLEKTHIQGGPSNSLFSLGCFYNNELIGVCSFGRHHRKAGVITLNRFACLADHTVMGFLSKASKLAYSKFQTPIISWADYSKSQATGYLSAGWEFEELLKPDYFYFNPKTREVISKQSRKKSSVNTPKNMTELEHSLLDGLVRLYDCGKIRLIYNPR